MDILKSIGLRRTKQTEQADPRQVPNSAGGFTFAIDDMARLRRFLVLGVDGGTYYAGAHELAKDNAAVVLELAASRTADVVAEIVAVSTAGRAPRQNPALFALAAATALGDEDGRRAALAALPLVARTGTHLFLFAGYVEQFRGWGRGLRRAVARWYTDAPVAKVAFQAVKYRQREGWSHRDLLRLAHPATAEPDRKALFDWICGRESAPAEHDALRIVEGFQRAQAATSGWARLVTEYGLSWEMLPDPALDDASVWEALLDKGMPPTALMRQLPRLTRLGLLAPTSSRTAAVAKRLADPERLRSGRVHPVNVLVAQRTYASGQGARGSATWEPSRPIVDALDAAFYAAFGAVEPTGKRTMLALDVSGSMAMPISGMPLSCREASAALALVTVATEAAYEVVGFSTSLTPLAISPRQRLDDVLRTVSGLPFAGTDCALPMVDALRRKAEIDTFVVYTDSETWYGDIHPHQALRRYRERMGIDAKLVVVAMTSTGFSIADPDDGGMLDVAGFDSAVPTVIGDFARGDK
ncbi:TROVE domain-containing protein [Labedaea rhizosphaerae]|uniref:60 kDa SS-A/Ro ribonucleoprotein n=1 Tax=Labedaea rhizosphaerae TaxID=598644 RepID=A0A4R6SD74_LABRH|nr:TROVE domain-containing protein [Labedaea rhizosphaerae]TDP97890.1 60 kDa SS-A/Ro ribonucleoprotein [Labedaea rhizosphaerae]